MRDTFTTFAHMMSDAEFAAFTIEHIAPIIFAAAMVALLLFLGKGKTTRQRARWGALISMVIPLMIVRDLTLQILAGELNPAEDLPLHLCRIVCFFLPYALWTQSRLWMGILYFMVLAGTLQAVLTPDLAEGYPRYQYFRYWILHAGLIALTLYGVMVMQWRPRWRDFWLAVLAAQVYLLMTLPVNYFLDANYGYTCYKPPVASIASYMGDWPWYILTGEVMMVVLYLLLMLPFVKQAQKDLGHPS